MREWKMQEQIAEVEIAGVSRTERAKLTIN